MWMKVHAGEQGVSKLFEFIPASDDNAKINVIRCTKNRQIMDILNEQIPRLSTDNEQTNPFTRCNVIDLANDVDLLCRKLIRQVERCIAHR